MSSKLQLRYYITWITSNIIAKRTGKQNSPNGFDVYESLVAARGFTHVVMAIANIKYLVQIPSKLVQSKHLKIVTCRFVILLVCLKRDS